MRKNIMRKYPGGALRELNRQNMKNGKPLFSSIPSSGDYPPQNPDDAIELPYSIIGEWLKKRKKQSE